MKFFPTWTYIITIWLSMATDAIIGPSKLKWVLMVLG